jgi:hypothetical protein
MAESSIVAVAFQDLSDAAADLSSGNTSPKAVRQSFARFISADYQLTQHMYKEYKAKTGESWKASKFDGWNAVTELFWELRRANEHPVSILVRDRYYIRAFEDAPEIVAEGTWEFSLEDQLAREPRDDLHIIDPISGRRILPTRTEYEFHLFPPTKVARELLTRIGDSNVQSLSEKCFKVFARYYQYYQDQLAQS